MGRENDDMEQVSLSYLEEQSWKLRHYDIAKFPEQKHSTSSYNKETKGEWKK